ncbi:MAG TPA: hypothetical protein PKA00_01165 [Saprospiraceae bacterium]|nr:hypothetical protein [Saprospiraceae bacterium]
MIDSLGALLSACMLGFVLVRFEAVFGMPVTVLYFLASLALIFFIYSLLCFLYVKASWRNFLKGIAAVNLLYCCLTLCLVFIHWDDLSVWGLLYFGMEIVVVSVLAVLEWLKAFH